MLSALVNPRARDPPFGVLAGYRLLVSCGGQIRSIWRAWMFLIEVIEAHLQEDVAPTRNTWPRPSPQRQTAPQQP